MKRIVVGVVLASGVCFSSAPARAWWPQGHSLISEASVRALPADVPLFFRRNAGQVAHCAQDPDLFKNPALPQVTENEAPDHFIDWELLQGRALPPTRAEFVRLCARLKVDPQRVGFAPYAIAEWTQRLTIAFAEHRKYPQDKNIQNKIGVYAGILSHYSADLCMPLHTTIDYDGRAKAGGISPKSGIHARIDSLPERLLLTPQQLAQGQQIQPVSNLMPAIMREIMLSRSQINAAYQLENQLPPESETQARQWKPAVQIRAWGTGRAREATRFTASLFLTAWRDSARVKLPSWLRRERTKAALSSTR